MYLKHKPSNDLVEVLDIMALTDPCQATFPGRFHAGEEIQESSRFTKTDCIFPSEETLPRCWLDAHYRNR